VRSMIKKTLLIPALVVTVVGASLWATTQTYAQDTNDPQTNLVQRIATKFNLNKDDVKKVFEEDRQEHHVQMQQKFEERLTQLVKDGKLTEDQKTKVLAKFKEMEASHEAEMDSVESSTPEERKTKMKAHKDELAQWAKDNGIDLNVLFDGHKGMMIRGGKHLQ